MDPQKKIDVPKYNKSEKKNLSPYTNSANTKYLCIGKGNSFKYFT